MHSADCENNIKKEKKLSQEPQSPFPSIHTQGNIYGRKINIILVYNYKHYSVVEFVYLYHYW